MKHSFPRDRIIFCSNHGSYLDLIKDSFIGAKIDAPVIYEKRDCYVTEWVGERTKNAYSTLRRWIILYCNELITQVNWNKTHFRLSGMKGVDSRKLPKEKALLLLDLLQRVLPSNVDCLNEDDHRLALRLFVRTLTQDFDKVKYRNMDYNNICDISLATVLNEASHDSEALWEIDEGDVSFLFLVAMRMLFKLPNKLSEYELTLIDLIGEAFIYTNEILRRSLEDSFSDIDNLISAMTEKSKTKLIDEINKRDKRNDLTLSAVNFIDKVNYLRKEGYIPPADHMRRLFQIWWHQFFTNDGMFKVSETLNCMAFTTTINQRIFTRSFGIA